MAERFVDISFGREGPDDNNLAASPLGSWGFRAGSDRGTDPDEFAAQALRDLEREHDRWLGALRNLAAGRWHAADYRGSKRVRDLSGWDPPEHLRERAREILRNHGEGV